MNSRNITISLLERGNMAGLNEIYISCEAGMLNIDENLINLDIVNYKIYRCMYDNCVTLRNEYVNNGFNLLDNKQVIYTDLLVKDSKAKISFKDLFDEYAKLREERGNLCFRK
ncbi:hypothetical protein EZS27_034886 [termite gut metagenome]|uniref:Uncharacterized protein n=1 Tax=termite gut metagenome TaxID=433724 RepID=A0A5J4PXU7_9ZZZZ